MIGLALTSLPSLLVWMAAASAPTEPLPAARPVAALNAKPFPTSVRRGRQSPRAPRRSTAALVDAGDRITPLEPRADFYVGAIQIYPWTEGTIYRLYTAPERVSDITLQAGEALVSVAAGDTARWLIAETASGAGVTRRTHILVKPSATGLTTNLLIATDRRVYHVDVSSIARSAMTSIAWTYPDDGMLALKGIPREREAPVTSEIAVEGLNFNYRIEGDSVPWRPLRAFDDGDQVFIEFPPALGKGEAPPLFVQGGDGQPELVNYRVRGHYYVVDRLFVAAELRLGGKRQKVVRIVRDGRVPRARAS